MKISNDSGWKEASAKAFEQQFALNLRELSDPPEHWRFFLEELERIKNPKRVVDIGCGVGSFSKLLRMWHGKIDYIGYDYSSAAIKTAKSMWGEFGKFEEKDYNELLESDIQDGDVIVANALCDVLPDGDDCFNKILSLGAKNVIFLRVRITEKESYYEEYEAYGEINTYAFYHNENKLAKMMDDNGYGPPRFNHFSQNMINLHMECNDKN
jgi:trans-aconitate methyltransferase